MSRDDPRADPAVGLCSVCRHAASQRNRRGSCFWRCRRADDDPAYLQYPPLPVTGCPGFETGEPAGAGDD